jgi:hypothetical protein
VKDESGKTRPVEMIHIRTTSTVQDNKPTVSKNTSSEIISNNPDKLPF